MTNTIVGNFLHDGVVIIGSTKLIILLKMRELIIEVHHIVEALCVKE